MKVIRYEFMPDGSKKCRKKEICSSEQDYQLNLSIAKGEAISEITVEDIEEDKIIAPRNIAAGEYVTIGDVLYLATENIPNGEPIIVGQNAVITTIEAQLHELKGK